MTVSLTASGLDATPSRMAALPRLDVMMMIAFLNDTVRPWLSVTRPSSSTCAAWKLRICYTFSHMIISHSFLSKTSRRARVRRAAAAFYRVSQHAGRSRG